MPAYNAGQFIARALASIENQTRLPDEVVVVDDGSSDDTGQCIERFRQSSGLNLVVRQQVNQGSSSARNHAVRVATGNFIAFMDADDIMYPRFLERMETGLDRHPDWVACFSDRDIVDPDGRLIAKDLDHPKFLGLSKKDAGMGYMELADDALFSTMLSGSLIPMTMVCRRAELEAVHGFDESLIFNEDRLLFLELIKRGGKLGYAAESLGTWQRHEANKSGSSNALRSIEASDLILRKILDDQRRLKLSPQECAELDSERKRLARGWMYAASRIRAASTFALGRRLLAEHRITYACFFRAIIRYALARGRADG
ncbi:glycosyltransferase [Dyella aluminiiresistens]|uniref:glycosyltransferase n=1 Tax=Dyella aluminiiresistens TaxID=3069105 RepID=UPI00399D1444